MNKSSLLIAIFSASLLLLSCDDANNSESRPPIVLGDSSMIVTETDSQYLVNSVLDIHRKEIIPEKTVSPPIHSPETSNNESFITNSSDFKIDFGEALVIITGIETKEFLNQNPKKANGVSYAKTNGDLSKSKLIIKNATNVVVKQRYQSALELKTGDEELPLKNLGLHTSEWKILKAEQSELNQFSFNLSDIYNVDFKSISNATLKNAVQKELKNKRVNNTIVQTWLKSIQKTRTAKDQPCVIKLNNVQWQISGTDENGNNFFKTIRLED